MSITSVISGMGATVPERGVLVDYLGGNPQGRAGAVRVDSDDDRSRPGRTADARLAPAPAPEPARPRARGGRLGAAPELRRDRAAPRPAPRWCCTSPSTSRCRCASATRCCWPPGTRPSTRETPLDDPEMAPVRDALDLILARPRALPGRSSSTGAGTVLGRQPRGGAADRRRGARAARAAAQRPAREPPSGRPRAAHRQPRRVARARDRAPRAPDRDVAATPRSAALLDELRAYPGRGRRPRGRGPRHRCSCRCGSRAGRELAFISTLATFGTAVDITSRELSIESFFPADERTAEVDGRTSSATST